MTIDIKHEICDFTCMWNGLEDIYRNKTLLKIPQHFFFGLSGFCNFVYMNFNNTEIPKLVYWNDGRPKKMYEFMGEKVGFSCSFIESRTFKHTMNVLKDEINRGNPVIIGSLDMFYLEYLTKFYHKNHIPIHYVLVVGYDDDKKQIMLYDCSREEIQTLSYENLEKAWNVNVQGLSKKNTLYKFLFSSDLNDIKSIFYSSLEKKYKLNIYAPVNFVGVKGLRKLAKDIMLWEQQLEKSTYKKCLLHLVEYTGFPPSLPDRKKLPEVRHTGVRHEFASLLKWGAKEYNEPLFLQSSEMFKKSGKYIEDLSYRIYDIAEGRQKMSNIIKDILEEISSTELKAFQYIEQVFQ